jgi:phosphoglycerol transferase
VLTSEAGPETNVGAAPADRVPGRGSRIRRWQGQIEIAVTVLSSCLLFALGFGGGPSRLAVPLGGGDLLPAYAASYLWSQGAPFGNSSLGFPFGMELRYYPTADVLQNLFAGVVARIWDNPFLGMNAAFAVSFPVTALAVLWVFRIAGLRGPVAVLGALALTFIPYHWYRIDHVYLGTMYSAVLGVGLALLVGTGAVERRLRSASRRRSLLELLFVAVLVGTSGIYYACFTILICVAAAVFRFAQGVGWRRLLLALTPVPLVLASLGAALLPATLYVAAHPAILPVADRLPVESVTYSGALAFAFLPAPVSRIPGFGPVNDLVNGLFFDASATPTSGVLWFANFGSLATVVAMAVFAVGGLILVRRAARRRAAGLPPVDDDPTAVSLGLIGLLLATAVLFFVPWGLNYLFADLVTPQLRGWDRLVPVLFTLVFLGAGTVLKRLGRRPGPVVGAGLAVLAVVLLVCDSVLPYRSLFAGAAANGSVFGAAGHAYAAELNEAVPGRCGVLELPYMGYPEEPNKGTMGNYEPLWPALTNQEKLWSFGAMKGTVASAWQRSLGDSLDPDDVPPLEAAGFCAVHVDRRAYSAPVADEVTGALEALLGAPVATGLDGHWLAYELPSPAADPLPVDELAAGAGAGDLGTFFAPPVITPASGTAAVASADGLRPTWWLPAGEAEFDVDSLDGGADFTALTGELQGPDCGDMDVIVELRSGEDEASVPVHLTAGATSPFSVRLDDPSRTAELTVVLPSDACTNGPAAPGTVALVGPTAVA